MKEVKGRSGIEYRRSIENEVWYLFSENVQRLRLCVKVNEGLPQHLRILVLLLILAFLLILLPFSFPCTTSC